MKNIKFVSILVLLFCFCTVY